MVGTFESNKDLVQDIAESGAERVGDIVGIIARSVRDVGRETASGAEKVANIAAIIAGTVRDVTHEIGDWITDGIEMSDAAKAARHDKNQSSEGVR